MLVKQTRDSVKLLELVALGGNSVNRKDGEIQAHMTDKWYVFIVNPLIHVIRILVINALHSTQYECVITQGNNGNMQQGNAIYSNCIIIIYSPFSSKYTLLQSFTKCAF